MVLMQFQVKVRPDTLSFFEEMIGDAIESMWWDEEGNVTGILAREKQREFEALFGLYCTESGLIFPPIHFSEMEARDWLEEDQKQLMPIEVGRFFIYPPQYEGEIPAGMVAFKIDSPQAFGSGHHETTKCCLEVLQELSHQFEASRALDVGTGSGILAMAIASLWKVSVYATDSDLASVIAARKNISENGIKGIEVVQSDGLEHELIKKAAPFDLIVANIHSEPLKRLASQIVRPLSPGGYVLLSGVLMEQQEGVLEQYQALGMRLEKAYQSGQWATLLLRLEKIAL